MNKESWFKRLLSSFSFVALVTGTLFFAASLSPSLLPRNYVVQGILSGFALAAGYGLGVCTVWLWQYLELPKPREETERRIKQVSTLGVLIVVSICLWRATVWQDSIRSLMEMPPLEGTYAPFVLTISIAIAIPLVGFGRLLVAICGFLDRRLKRIFPRRISNVLSVIIVGLLVLLLANRVVARFALTVADTTYLKVDGMVEDGIDQPTDDMATGSERSLVKWDWIGKRGKEFIATGPTQEQISEFSGKQARKPLRVYVGLGYGETPQDRAKLALEELKRVGGFERSVLVVATPTGTGWIHPNAVDPLEYLHAGDTAIVSMQYSYLPSFITILVDPNRSIDSGQALFDEVYGHWKTLPQETRPKLYLHGLSLGSLGSESCADIFTLFEDPIQGGVWSGPPFPSAYWSSLTKGRNPDSPAWLPRFRDGKMVRFTSRQNALDQFGESWGKMRFVYIQHASDPITFFEPQLLYRKPEWLEEERGPDVSPYLTWYPVVTFLQVGFDMSMSGSVPDGYGHNYAAQSYIDAWVEVTQPQEWSTEDTARLKDEFVK